MAKSRSHREFELLVSRLERQTWPPGTIVTSPERITDSRTGQKRECDITVRYRVGSVSLLVLIECRDHSVLQDVRWLEQLASKRHGIGADITIAVSATPFTAPAIRFGAAERIELRTIQEFIPDHTTQTGLDVLTTEQKLEARSISFSITPSSSTESPSVTPAHTSAIRSDIWNAPLVYARSDNQALTLARLIQLSGSDGTAIDDGVTVGAPPTDRVLRLRFAPGQVDVPTDVGPRDVNLIEVRVGVSLESIRHTPTTGHSYRSVQGSEFAHTFRYDLRETDSSGLVIESTRATPTAEPPVPTKASRGSRRSPRAREK